MNKRFKNQVLVLGGDSDRYPIQNYFISVEEKAEECFKKNEFDRYKMQVDIIDILSNVKLEITVERALKKILEKCNKMKLIGN